MIEGQGQGKGQNMMRFDTGGTAVLCIESGDKPSEHQRGGIMALWPTAGTLKAGSPDSQSTHETIG